MSCRSISTLLIRTREGRCAARCGGSTRTAPRSLAAGCIARSRWHPAASRLVLRKRLGRYYLICNRNQRLCPRFDSHMIVCQDRLGTHVTETLKRGGAFSFRRMPGMTRWLRRSRMSWRRGSEGSRRCCPGRRARRSSQQNSQAVLLMVGRLIVLSGTQTGTVCPGQAQSEEEGRVDSRRLRRVSCWCGRRRSGRSACCAPLKCSSAQVRAI